MKGMVQRALIRARAWLRVVRGRSGPYTIHIFQSPWWKPYTVRMVNGLKNAMRQTAWRLRAQWGFHVLAAIGAILPWFYEISLHPASLIATTVAVAGLSSIGITLIAGMVTYSQGYLRWLWLVITDTGLPTLLTMDVTVVILTMMAATKGSGLVQSFTFLLWIESFRTVLVAFHLVDRRRSVVERVREFCRSNFDRSLPQFDRRLYPLSFPAIKLKRSLWLRFQLATADMTVFPVASTPILWLRLSPNPKTLNVEVVLAQQGSDNVSVEIARLNECFKEQFWLAKSHDPALPAIESDARWLSEMAYAAVQQDRWADFTELVKTHAYLTSQAVQALESDDKNFSLFSLMIYTWNLPSAAFELVAAESPWLATQDAWKELANLLLVMVASKQSLQDYLDLLLVPTMRALLFRRNSSDLWSVAKQLISVLTDALRVERNNSLVASTFLGEHGIVPPLVEILRTLQAEFLGDALYFRQWVGLMMIQGVLDVGNWIWHSDSEETSVRRQIVVRDQLQPWLTADRWEQLIGETEEQPKSLRLHSDIQSRLREILDGALVRTN